MLWFTSLQVLSFAETISTCCISNFILSYFSPFNHRNSSDPESHWPGVTYQKQPRTRGMWQTSLRPCRRPGRSAVGRGRKRSRIRGRNNTSRRENGVAGSSRSKTDNPTNPQPWPAWHDEAWPGDKATGLSENSLSSIHHSTTSATQGFIWLTNNLFHKIFQFGLCWT